MTKQQGCSSTEWRWQNMEGIYEQRRRFLEKKNKKTITT